MVMESLKADSVRSEWGGLRVFDRCRERRRLCAEGVSGITQSVIPNLLRQLGE
jgi:hypothetical protein